MSVRGKGKGRKTPKKMTDAGIEESDREETEEEMGESHAKLMLEGLARLTREIQDFQTTMRSELTTFKTEIKQDITSLHQDMEQKFRENSGELKEQKANLAAAQERIAELEEWNTDANVSLQRVLAQTRNMQER
ncbi:hypothetical protein WMY93_015041 [Mugilogobius chulae]|uniref:Coiled-coil domain-containing protein 153 n=1 Tax=Mugilogobius chulae TaxID=88201 RepID=A0AAW0P3B4_9GOBI